MGQIYQVLGDAKGAAAMQAEAASIATAFQTTFYNASQSTYGTGSDDEVLYAIGVGLVPTALIPNVTASLQKQVQQRGFFQVDNFGVWILRDLLELGDIVHDVAKWLVRTEPPSYGYFMNNAFQNATTMMEHWATPEEDTSHNHAWLNSVSLLFRARILGLRPVWNISALAWGQARVRPWPAALQADTGVPTKGAKGATDTMQGAFKVEWLQASDSSWCGDSDISHEGFGSGF